MATTLPSDLFIPEVCDAYARQEYATSLMFLNEAFGTGPDAMILIPDPGELANGGQYRQRPTFAQIANLIRRTDLTSVSTVTGKSLVGVNDQEVLVNKTAGHVEFTPEAEYLSKANAGDISAEVGKQAGEQSAGQIQTSVINMLNGVLDAFSATAHTNTVWQSGSRTNLSRTVLDNTIQKMGDFREKIEFFLVRSDSNSDLLQSAFTQGFASADRALNGDISGLYLGRRHAIVDDPALTITDAGFDKYLSIGLGKGAARCTMVKPLTWAQAVHYNNTDLQTVHIRADMSYALGVPGFGYVNSVGLANPSDTTLNTSSSWSVNYTNAKQVPIVKAVHNYSGN